MFSVKDYMVGYPIFAYPSIYPTRKASGIWTSTWLFSSPWTVSSSDKTICVADHPNSEFWQRIGQPYAHNQGDVLLPLSTLKRTVWPAVSTVADVVRLRGTAVKLSDARRLSGRVGGQATNNLPMMEQRKTIIITKTIKINL